MDGTTGEVVKGAKFLSSADTWWCRCQRLPTFPSYRSHSWRKASRQTRWWLYQHPTCRCRQW
ncbi:hypothetical protein PR003_g3203 [Phytophthora rubi]|uniref:Uncharacterized protein n=1 Tax=Phytophthora rubi TaxID=129364 RepID=A0A6A4FW44_9STRA|nr:hypothetical protein PR003_g3203 [Phytophthora rubi]